MFIILEKVDDFKIVHLFESLLPMNRHIAMVEFNHQIKQVLEMLFGPSVSVRYLPPLHIHRIIFFIDQIGHPHEFVAFAFQRRDQRIQCLRSVLGSVVAQDDGAVAQMLVVAYGINDGVYAVVLPVQAVHILNTWIQLVLEALRCMEGNKIYSN